MIYSVVNPKGGTGKSRTVEELARLWPETGRRLLVVGLDPVGSMTRRLLGLGEDWPGHVGQSMAEVLRNQARMESVAVPAIFDGVDLAPESPTLKEIEGELAGAHLGTLRLMSALRSLQATGLYDDVLIDSPGTMGTLVKSAILASDRVVVASTAEENSIDGLRAMLDAYREIYSDPTISPILPHLPPAMLVGQVVTKYRGSIISHRDALAGLNELLPVLGTVGLHAGRDADALIAEAYGPIFWNLLEGMGGYPVDWPAARIAGGVA